MANKKSETNKNWETGQVVTFTDQGDFFFTTIANNPALSYVHALTIAETEPETAVFLGVFDNTPYWFIDEHDFTLIRTKPRNGLHLDKNLSTLDKKIIAKVCGYIHFHHSFLRDFTHPTFHGKARTNDKSLLVFPRLDPAIIVLITNKAKDKILLSRNALGNENFLYSPPAGFVEVGETLEEAVEREVKEELGIEVEDIRYHSSQSWPAPQSLMFGFLATTLLENEQFTFPDGELVDAKWLTKSQVQDIRNRTDTSIIIPEGNTVAGKMINEWLAS